MFSFKNLFKNLDIELTSGAAQVALIMSVCSITTVSISMLFGALGITIVSILVALLGLKIVAYDLEKQRLEAIKVKQKI